MFYVNVPIGVLAFALALRLLPRSEKKQFRMRSEIDFLGIALLAVAVLGVLLPVIDSDSGGPARLWWMFVVALVFGFAFVRWERSVVRRGRTPLLDTRLFTGTPGYAAGAAVGALYFCGFAGIWLVFAMFFQQGLGYTPLQSGLSVTPFALGSAVSAAVAGRLVPTFGRRLTVTGLAMVALGLLAVALLAQLVPPSASGWAFALPLLFAGVGGGMVISPNTTLTLECVPVRMAGVAGGALQTGPADRHGDRHRRARVGVRHGRRRGEGLPARAHRRAVLRGRPDVHSRWPSRSPNSGRGATVRNIPSTTGRGSESRDVRRGRPAGLRHYFRQICDAPSE